MKCKICNKQTEEADFYSYSDIERGLKNIRICYLCLLKHTEKYYGDCPISRNIRQLYDMPKEKELLLFG